MRKLLFVSALLMTPLLVSSCATSPTGRSQLMLAGDSKMNDEGVKAFDQLKKETPINHDPALNRYVHCIVDPITQIAGRELKISNWEVVVFESKEVNAFALPGGKIGVYTGMLTAATNADQLAAVLGHETGHVIAHHGAERASQTMLAGLLTAAVAGGTEIATKDQQKANYAMLAMNGLSQYGYLLPYSRKQEAEADIIGLKLMSQAGFDPHAAVILWQNMIKVGGKQPAEILSTHPSDEHRIEAIQNHMSEDVVIYRAAPVKHRCVR